MDWVLKIISVSKVDMVLVQSNPTEIYELDIDIFRLALKGLEESVAGMIYPQTHNHVTPVNVGGVSLARVVELTNGYTVTFEDGQYAVNLVGANSNVGDKVNVNQVSVRSANSAGLVEVGTGGGGGSGLTAEQAAQVLKIFSLEELMNHIVPSS